MYGSRLMSFPVGALRCTVGALLICLSSSFAVSQTTQPALPTPQAQGRPVEAVPPVSIGVIIDLSYSTQQSAPRNSKKLLLDALTNFVKQNNQQNDYFVISIQTQPKILLDVRSDAVPVLKLWSKLRSASPEGATALFDACYLALTKIKQGQHAKKALLIISDGVDTVSTKSFDDLLQLWQGQSIPIYAIDIGYEITKRYPDQAGGSLNRIVAAAGGKAYHPLKPTELHDIFGHVTEELRH